MARKALTSAGFLAALLAVGSSLAWAQAPAPQPAPAPATPAEEAAPTPTGPSAGWYVTPSFRLSEEFNDNIFATSSGQKSDFITRATPGLKLGYRSTPLTLEAGYSFDAEYFAKNPELSGAANARRAVLELKYLPTPLATLGLSASYIETQTATTLVSATGLALGRRLATELLISPTASYRFTELTSATGSYSFDRTTLAGFATNTLQRGTLTLSHRVTPTDTALLGYRISVFETEGVPSLTSHTPTVGWSHRFTEFTTLTLQAGPRFTDGSTDAEADAKLEHRFKLARVSLEYSRTEASVISLGGVTKVESVIGSVVTEPVRFLELTLGPSYRKLSPAGARDITVYGVDATASYRLTSWLSARGAYSFVLQKDGAQITNNIFSISLEATYPVRVY